MCPFVCTRIRITYAPAVRAFRAIFPPPPLFVPLLSWYLFSFFFFFSFLLLFPFAPLFCVSLSLCLSSFLLFAHTHESVFLLFGFRLVVFLFAFVVILRI